MATMFGSIKRVLYWFYKIHIMRSEFHRTLRAWYAVDGDQTLRLDYPLSQSSLVFDVGGYRGDWADAIHQRYRARILIFEPATDFFLELRRRFDGCKNIEVFHFGLSSDDIECKLSLNADGSSIYQESDCSESVQLRDVVAFLDKRGIDHIDLIKINIEGGEYDLLPRMIESGVARRCSNIQIQFHDFIAGAKEKREAIRAMLLHSHSLSFDYPFVWESWSLMPDSRSE